MIHSFVASQFPLEIDRSNWQSKGLLCCYMPQVLGVPQAAVTEQFAARNLAQPGNFDLRFGHLAANTNGGQLITIEPRFQTYTFGSDTAARYRWWYAANSTFATNHPLKADPWTWSCWVRVDAAGNQSACGIIARDDGFFSGQGLYASTAASVTFNAYSGTYNTTATSGAKNYGQWYHLVAVKNGTSMRLFVNGVLDGTQTVTASPTLTDHEVTIAGIGANDATFWASLRGRMFDARWYDWAMPDHIATRLYWDWKNLYRDHVEDLLFYVRAAAAPPPTLSVGQRVMMIS